MPRGGRRVGAGRKPKAKGPGVVIGMDGRRQNPPLPGVSSEPDHDDVDLLVPPSDLTPGARRAWRRMAPAAIDQQTLVPATVWGFRRLCTLWNRADLMDQQLQRAGSGPRGAALQGTALKLETRLDAALARFKLTGFGKPADKKETKSGAANPWAEVAR
jgi:hypothetical protein